MIKKYLKLSMILVVALALAGSVQSQKPKETRVEGHTMYTLMEPGAIPAIFDPQFVSVNEAESLYYENEPLMVVTAGGETKGYSTWHLDRHEVVNDYIGGRPIAVTW